MPPGGPGRNVSATVEERRSGGLSDACGIFHKRYLVLAMDGTEAMSINSGGNGEDRDAASGLAAAGQYAGLGLQFAMAVGLFMWLGWVVDHRLGWTPVLTIVGAFVGAGGGFYSMYRRLILEPRRDEASR
jgi:F0F1-type ATP synthase assembly protein I